MSRVAKLPVRIPKGVEVGVDGRALTVKGPKGTLSREVNAAVAVEVASAEGEVRCRARAGAARANAHAGTVRALLNNMVRGVTDGYERRLQLVGVGYRAQADGGKLTIALGYSHPVEYAVPDGIKIETPSLTEIVVKGIDKQQVGQVAAVIRAFRPPEPYKGKGVKYADEVLVRKEAKKK